jgi:hypothetical protein
MSKKEVPLCLFSSRPEVAGFELKPLTAGRILVLESLGHPIAVGMRAGQVVSKEQLFQLVLVASLDDRELAELQVDADEREWKIRGAEVAMKFQDGDMQKLWEIVEKEVSEIEAAKAVPKKKNASRGAGSRVLKNKATRRTGG